MSNEVPIVDEKKILELSELLKVAKPKCPSCKKVISIVTSVILMCRECFWIGHAIECSKWVFNSLEIKDKVLNG